MLKNFVRIIGGDPNKKEIQNLAETVGREINNLEYEYEALSDAELRGKTDEFKNRLNNGETLDDLLVEAFAAVREASKRTIGLRHYDIQMIGGYTLHSGRIAEMRTGEGKTLVATLPIYLNALHGRGVHLVTVNDYLARRDARWKHPIFKALGLSVGVLQMASRSGSGKTAYLVDDAISAAREDQDKMRLVPRKEAYQADITYGTNSEFGFDYLRDNLTLSLNDRVQRGHHYCIIDEVDNILIDEARTPLIISGPASGDTEWFNKMAQVVRQLNPEDYEVSEKDRNVSLTEIGEVHVEELLGMQLRDPERPEDITPEQARIMGYLEQGLRAHHLYKRNKHYLVQGGQVVIVDDFTGRLMPGRRWSEGLHQSVEAKEGVKVNPENVTHATITLQNYYRKYEKLSGMTGTALTESEEFDKIYKLDVLPIPPNLEFVSSQKDSALEAINNKDEFGYEYTYYAKTDDTEKAELFYKRKDYPDVVYRSEEAKLRAMTREIILYHVIGRPQLVGTTSVENSDVLSNRLKPEPIRRLLQVFMLRQAYLDHHGIEIVDRPLKDLEFLNEKLLDLKTNMLRPLAKELNLSLNPELPENVALLARVFGLSVEGEERLLQVIQGGIPHKVLNARKHDEESKIIADAGAFGAVTIATNMAGRGVDIKLGGELSEVVLQSVNRFLEKSGLDPYEMTNEERVDALDGISSEDFSFYEEDIETFRNYIKNMALVWELGGLHVIGSERHEARRIDNQLRGRAARQGDPGSSRFYLSLEDELMRLFGGQQVENLWKRIFFDESLPLEMRMIGRLVEQSQERVEGANFDVRKHLLEYDDVLNAQRERIYSQRDRVFTKEDLREDIFDMLGLELNLRVPKSLEDEEGPWRLLAYLDDIQPAFEYETIGYPSFSLRLLLDEIYGYLKESGESTENLKAGLLDLAERSLEAEKNHLLKSAQVLLEQSEENMKRQLDERYETLENILDGLEEGDENGQQPSSQEVLNQIVGFVRVPVRLKPNQLRDLVEADDEIVDEIKYQIETHILSLTLNRLLGALERRLEDSLDLKVNELQEKSWDEVYDLIIETVENVFEERFKRLFGENGEISRDLNLNLKSDEVEISDRVIRNMLILMTKGTRLIFDRKTHRRGTKQVTRLKYFFLAAHLLDVASNEEITERVLTHMEGGLETLENLRGLFEWNRLRQVEAHLENLNPHAKTYLSNKLGKDVFVDLEKRPLESIDEEIVEQIQVLLGRYAQNSIYRELLLRSISEEWVEYLTQVEALRVSIRMEAYAQRDPLVEYKSKATEMFKGLLVDIRMRVISRVFKYQGRQAAAAESRSRAEVANSQPVDNEQGVDGQKKQTKKKKSRKRH
ncbi:MAG: hypothetical protein JEZ06_08355 [Anaerolineaceae bacterium]|nr:hypothetical protein [Anaerolineaceae bacterium]